MIEFKIVVHNDGKITVGTPGNRAVYPTRTYTDLGRALGLVSVLGMKELSKSKVAV